MSYANSDNTTQYARIYESAQSHLGLLFSTIYSTLSIASVSRQRRP